jgi:hypothetical protein
MSKTLGLLTVLGSLVLPLTVHAQFQVMDSTRVLTIHGTVAADEKGAQKVGYDAVSIGFVGAPADAMTWVGVAAAIAFDGDAFEGRNILATLDGYTPNLLASGRADLIAKIRNASSGSRLVFNGVLDPPSRNFLLTSVRVVPAGNAP